MKKFIVSLGVIALIAQSAVITAAPNRTANAARMEALQQLMPDVFAAADTPDKKASLEKRFKQIEAKLRQKTKNKALVGAGTIVSTDTDQQVNHKVAAQYKHFAHMEEYDNKVVPIIQKVLKGQPLTDAERELYESASRNNGARNVSADTNTPAQDSVASKQAQQLDEQRQKAAIVALQQKENERVRQQQNTPADSRDEDWADDTDETDIIRQNAKPAKAPVQPVKKSDDANRTSAKSTGQSSGAQDRVSAQSGSDYSENDGREFRDDTGMSGSDTHSGRYVGAIDYDALSGNASSDRDSEGTVPNGVKSDLAVDDTPSSIHAFGGGNSNDIVAQQIGAVEHDGCVNGMAVLPQQPYYNRWYHSFSKAHFAKRALAFCGIAAGSYYAIKYLYQWWTKKPVKQGVRIVQNKSLREVLQGNKPAAARRTTRGRATTRATGAKTVKRSVRPITAKKPIKKSFAALTRAAATTMLQARKSAKRGFMASKNKSKTGLIAHNRK